MSFAINTDEFPLVLIEYPRQASLEEIDAYIESLAGILARGRICTIVDIRNVSVVAGKTSTTAKHRKHLATRLDEITLGHPNRIVSEAIIFDSTVMRGLYTAFSWLRKDKSYASRAFKSIKEARAWTNSQVVKAGLS